MVRRRMGAYRSVSDLFLVRHGQTEWNLVQRIQGHSDSPLTAAGVEQANAAGRLLAAMLEGRSAVLVSSPLGRARRTAEIVAGALGLPANRIRIEPRLREVSWGAWDGRSRAELEAAEPGAWNRLQRDWSFAPEGAEAYPDAAGRLGDWLRSLSAGEPVIAVTHGMASAILRGLLLQLTGAETLALERPQDALFHVRQGRIQKLAYG
jgi:probable phosphoglycerate mutase